MSNRPGSVNRISSRRNPDRQVQASLCWIHSLVGRAQLH